MKKPPDAEIRRENLRVIKAELRNYWQSKKLYEQDIADEIALRCNYPQNDADQIRGSETSDPTSIRAERLDRLLTGLEMRERRRRLEAISNVMDLLKAHEPSRYKLVELYYWKGHYTPEGIVQQLNIDRATFFRWHSSILTEIAEKLGWAI